MKTFMTTTALVMAFATSALAQDAPVSPYREGVEKGVRASQFIGKRVYLTAADTSTMAVEAIADANTDWVDAGEISDVMISLMGDTEVALVDFGGFLGIGEKTVAIDMNQLVLVPDSDSPQDYFIVFQGDKSQLEGAPAFNPDMVFAASDVVPVTSDPASTTISPATDAPLVAVDGDMVDLTVMTDTDLIGKRVYGINAEDVGEISAVALDETGKISGAIVDVGGFLGMGEKKVALTGDMLRLVADASGGDAKLHVNATQEQLEALPVYAN
ncbi:MAG: PRC-barrel domain-containing protein [Sideroxyarcus sp.]|nr:PRC-barrel domain-containing protein [Sideroxyarcus sp.]